MIPPEVVARFWVMERSSSLVGPAHIAKVPEWAFTAVTKGSGPFATPCPDLTPRYGVRFALAD